MAAANAELEVYILLKDLGRESYTDFDRRLAHHICLLKFKDEFYYTDLASVPGADGDSKSKGPVKLRFDKYKFYDGYIGYQPVGVTRKTLKDIEMFVEKNDRTDTIYSLWSNNCQHYVKACIDFLDIKNPVHPYNFPYICTARNPSEITLNATAYVPALPEAPT
jgi:hypothetical protein